MKSHETVGIWKLGETIHQSDPFRVARCQPNIASGSPRWDYVIKSGSSELARAGLEASIGVSSAITHPNLVPVLDGDARGELPYIMMPALAGQTMAELLIDSSRCRLPVALWMVRQLCQALEAMHREGWTHGDVKPSNVIVGENGHATLIDLAFAYCGTPPASFPFVGTPEYAAPELVHNASARTPASDVFATGRVLWEWMTRVETSDESLLTPICRLVETMVAERPSDRPSASSIIKELLRLEIDSLGEHISPPTATKSTRRAA
ncbi:MAG: protein kinase [Planctomycetota bacterium]